MTLASGITRFFRFFRHIHWQTLQQVLERAAKQRLPGLSAEMAYNAMLALFPAILALLNAIGLVQASRSTLEKLAYRLSEVAPEQVLILIENFIEQITVDRSSGMFSLSFFVALWISSGAISAAMAALDQIHQLPRSQRRPFWKAKLISLLLTIGTIVLLVVACFLFFISDLLVGILAKQSNVLGSLLLSAWRLLSWPLSLGMVAAAFAFIYRYGPSRWHPGTPLIPGAAIAAILWAFASGIFRFYVGNFANYNRIYGAVGAIAILLLWLYLTSLSMLFGAQLNVTVGHNMHRHNDLRSTSRQNPTPKEQSKDQASATEKSEKSLDK